MKARASPAPSAPSRLRLRLGMQRPWGSSLPSGSAVGTEAGLVFLLWVLLFLPK